MSHERADHPWRRHTRRVSPATALSLMVFVLVRSLIWPAAASGAWQSPSTQLSSGGWVSWPGPPANATETWSLQLSGQVSGGPIVDPEGNVFLVVGDSIEAYSAAGASLWQATVTALCPGSPVLMDHAQIGRQVVALTSSPKAIRAISAVSGEQTWVAALPATPAGPPMVGPNGHLYFVTSDGRLRVFSANGTALWTYSLGCASSVPLAHNTSGWVYSVLSNGTAVAIDAARRTLVWRSETGLAPASGPALAGDGTVFFATVTGHGVCVSPGGATSWSLDLGTRGAPLITAEGDAVFAGLDGCLTRVSRHGVTAWATDLGDCAPPQQPIGDDLGIIHVAVDGRLCRVSQQGVVLAPAFDLASAIERAVLPSGLTALSCTSAGALHMHHASSPSDPAIGPVGPCTWLPELLLPEPDGGNGWYRQAPQVAVAPASLAAWPGGLEIAWSATSLAGQEHGVLTANTPDFTINLEGEISVVVSSLGDISGGGNNLSLAVDRTAPGIEVAGARGGIIAVFPGTFCPAPSCLDQGSGLAAVEVWLDGAQLEGPCELAGGWHDLKVRALDIAGNVSEADYRVAAAAPCTASSLSPVISATLPAATPFWSRGVTVMVRLPVQAVATTQPSNIAINGSVGTITARLPVIRGATSRVYMVRFDRDDIVAAIQSLAPVAPAARLVPVELTLTATVEEDLFSAPVRFVWRP